MSETKRAIEDAEPTATPAVVEPPRYRSVVVDLSQAVQALADGRPVDLRQAAPALGMAVGGAWVGAAVLGALGLKGPALGALGSVLGALAVEAALVRWGRR